MAGKISNKFMVCKIKKGLASASIFRNGSCFILPKVS